MITSVRYGARDFTGHSKIKPETEEGNDIMRQLSKGEVTKFDKRHAIIQQRHDLLVNLSAQGVPGS